MRPTILSLYDFTGTALKPWAESGYECVAFDIQHSKMDRLEHYDGGGSIRYMNADLHNQSVLDSIVSSWKNKAVHMVLNFPVCTDLACSGAPRFAAKRAKNPSFQRIAADHCIAAAGVGQKLGCRWMLENPVSVLSTLWSHKKAFCFHPFEFGGWIAEDQAEHPTWPEYIAPKDAYSKKTCIWASNDFVRPEKREVTCESFGHSRQHSRLGGTSTKTKNIRSASPRGFFNAVFAANKLDTIT